MIPTAHNIKAVANARAKRIGEKGGSVDDVIARAEHYANRSHNPAATAQAAVSWAIHDLGNYDDGLGA